MRARVQIVTRARRQEHEEDFPASANPHALRSSLRGRLSGRIAPLSGNGRSGELESSSYREACAMDEPRLETHMVKDAASVVFALTATREDR